ncbi:hypothetical protein PI87_27025 [Ralstonia sp. A12]|uniref:hypothetical protein n=1 Tax=Ralstonia sp. A12 TaxID=1217052 RepID=UPI000573D102|nr:hypothetical protein [Ralstonia sp. A12]KHK49117.1 hypothetical protein PI87_27025 [Ralstonia sp. A12]
MIHYRDRAVSIVVLGEFAPARFHPEWFLRNHLMTSDDLGDVVIAMVGPGATQWTHPRFGDFLALPDRVSLTCKIEALWMVARDLVEGIIGLDAGNAIRALGINLHMVAVLEDDDANPGVWNALGDVLAPKELWREALALPDKDGFPGLEGIKLAVPDPDLIGSKRVFAFEPDLATVYNLAILVNNHFDITRACISRQVGETEANATDVTDSLGLSQAELSMQLLFERYETAISDSREQTEAILSAAVKQARLSAVIIEKRRAKEN